jgi:choline dehydrogenase-like flavoprotein
MADGSREVYADESFPDGAWVDGLALTADEHASFDVIVIGSGAAGSVAAHRLATAGLRVAIVEEGPWVRTKDLGGDVIDGFRTLFRDAGLQAIEGRAFMPLLQGRCVGGSTVINSAIAWRVPEDVLADWSARFGVPLSMDVLDPHYRALEEELSVHAVADEALGENNRRFLEHAARSGLDAQPMRRYEKDCEGSGRCLTGCPRARKQAMNVTMIPRALWRGARIFSSARVRRVLVEGGRARGVEADVVGRDGKRHRLVLHADKAVVLAASTVQTPGILRRSGVRSTHLGEHFQAHPGLAVLGVFDDPVNMSFGATQGADSIQYRKDGRFKIETISMPPELVIARMPGAGVELAQRMIDYAHVGMWAVQIRAQAEGRVTRNLWGRERVSYSLTPNDMAIARRACGVLARLFFEAGAREVWPGVFGVPPVLRSIDEVRAIDEGPLDARAYSFIATHLFGAARMGPDPRSSVVSLDFEVHGARGLYVVDSSVFPTNLGVNPQHTIMALSSLAAGRIAQAA